MAAGFYGPDTCSDGWSSSPLPAAFLVVATVAAERRPKPTNEPAEPSVGVNIGRSSRHPREERPIMLCSNPIKAKRVPKHPSQ